FLLTSGGGNGNVGNFGNKWGAGALVAQNAITTVIKEGGDSSINMSAPGYYTLVFRDAGYTNSSLYLGYTSNAPVTISHNPLTQTTVSNAVGTVTATLSGTPSSQEKFFV